MTLLEDLVRYTGANLAGFTFPGNLYWDALPHNVEEGVALAHGGGERAVDLIPDGVSFVKIISRSKSMQTGANNWQTIYNFLNKKLNLTLTNYKILSITSLQAAPLPPIRNKNGLDEYTSTLEVVHVQL